MRSTKKANNYFEKPILHESLFHEEIVKEYRVGGRKIESGWLKNEPPSSYRANIKSALELIALNEQYNNLELKSRTHPVDMFRLAELRKQIDNFERMELSPRKHFKPNFRVEEEGLRVQKIVDFWGLYERGCKIVDVTLFIESQKEKTDKPVDLRPYQIELDHKNRQMKETAQFVWLKGYEARLFLHG